MTDQRTPTELDAIADAHLDAVAAADPIFATLAGVAGDAAALTDLSPAGHEVRHHLVRGTLTALEGVHAHDPVDEVTLAAMNERLHVDVELHELGLDLASLNNVESPVQGVREVFDLAATDSEQDWSDVAARLAAVDGALAGYRESLRAAVAGGWRPPARQVLAASGQAEGFGAPDGFFVDLAAQARTTDDAPLPTALSDRLMDAGRAAATSYAELADWLRAELTPVARDDDAVGREEYGVRSRSFLGADVDLDEAYAWGLEELARVERRMAGVARGLAPDAPSGDDAESTLAAIAAGIEALDADPARTITGAEGFRDWMQEVSDRSLADLRGTHVSIPDPLMTLRCRIAPSSSGVVYYSAPSEDFSRPGQMWWSVPAGVTEFSTWRETSTVFHEGVPGHHLQLGRAVHARDRLNRWRRLGIWVSGHGEGWALYAERLMEELGYLDDAGDLMGMLDAHALRAARVVVDIGVHCRLAAPAELGGGTWDAERAWTFLRRHTRGPDEQLRFEWERYLGWPGQAPSYKLGERVWLDLRAEVEARQGAAFDLRAFHDTALGLGALPLGVLRTAVLAALPA